MVESVHIGLSTMPSFCFELVPEIGLIRRDADLKVLPYLDAALTSHNNDGHSLMKRITII
jgi:hypothetical protein